MRQNDQYTLLDEAKADLGMDLDGDGIDEQADIGIYRKVIGNDSVTLPGRGATTALRVDMVALVRAYASKTGEATPLIQITQSNWYAPGIGLVRIQLTGPDNLGASEVYDEILASVTGIPTAVEASATQAHPSTAAAEAVAHAQGVGARMIAAAARAAIASAH